MPTFAKRKYFYFLCDQTKKKLVGKWDPVVKLVRFPLQEFISLKSQLVSKKVQCVGPQQKAPLLASDTGQGIYAAVRKSQLKLTGNKRERRQEALDMRKGEKRHRTAKNNNDPCSSGADCLHGQKMKKTKSKKTVNAIKSNIVQSALERHHFDKEVVQRRQHHRNQSSVIKQINNSHNKSKFTWTDDWSRNDETEEDRHLKYNLTISIAGWGKSIDYVQYYVFLWSKGFCSHTLMCLHNRLYTREYIVVLLDAMHIFWCMFNAPRKIYEPCQKFANNIIFNTLVLL